MTITTDHFRLGEGAPNFDAHGAEWLTDFWHLATVRAPVRLARKLFRDRPKGYVTATRDLGHYAANLATARRCRERGQIESARAYERIADSIYDSLPSFARW